MTYRPDFFPLFWVTIPSCNFSCKSSKISPIDSHNYPQHGQNDKFNNRWGDPNHRCPVIKGTKVTENFLNFLPKSTIEILRVGQKPLESSREQLFWGFWGSGSNSSWTSNINRMKPEAKSFPNGLALSGHLSFCKFTFLSDSEQARNWGKIRLGEPIKPLCSARSVEQTGRWADGKQGNYQFLIKAVPTVSASSALFWWKNYDRENEEKRLEWNWAPLNFHRVRQSTDVHKSHAKLT